MPFGLGGTGPGILAALLVRCAAFRRNRQGTSNAEERQTVQLTIVSAVGVTPIEPGRWPLDGCGLRRSRDGTFARLPSCGALGGHSQGQDAPAEPVRLNQIRRCFFETARLDMLGEPRMTSGREAIAGFVQVAPVVGFHRSPEHRHIRVLLGRLGTAPIFKVRHNVLSFMAHAGADAAIESDPKKSRNDD
jgi:hypothetical protein